MNVPGKMIKMAGDLEKEIEAAFSELIHAPWGGRDILWRPAVDIYDTGDGYLLVADLPGTSLSNIEMRFEAHSLILYGTRRMSSEETRGHRLFIERASGRFCRKMDLPELVDLNKVKSDYQDGVFKAYIPKVNPKKFNHHKNAA
jgi:HSP20 family protein